MNKTTTTQSPAEFTKKFINETNRSVFLTGKAGTGKTTLLKKIIDATHKNTVVVAPTGIAALNAGGVTIHSFFQLPFGSFLPTDEHPPFISDRTQVHTKATLMRNFRMNQQRKAIIRNLELLIIDEVSMLRADILDAMDHVLRKVRRNNTPFGGVQLLYIGDLLQLPPIVKREEKEVLKKFYQGHFFFHAKAVKERPPLYIELDKIHRQDDKSFIEILNHLRNNFVSDSDVEVLNQYVKPKFDSTEHEGFITLTTHNRKAEEMNADSLAALKDKTYKYSAEVTGDFPSHMFPLADTLHLKVGAQVMFVKNDISYEKQFYNGKIGRVSKLSQEAIHVHFPEENLTIEVEKYEWENVKYSLDEKSGEIQEEVKGTFVHFPIKLAWAITVHKSQGLTFEKAVLDLNKVFAPGQAYVALSRLRSLKGLVLLNPIRLNGLSNNQHVEDYAQNKASTNDLAEQLETSTILFLNEKLAEAFNWDQTVSKWLALEHAHKNASERSEMGKNTEWFSRQVQLLLQTLEPARKFRNQLFRMCQPTTFDIDAVYERVEAAYQYFIKFLEPVFRENLKQLLLLGTKTGTKQYVEELAELDEQITTVILDLKKARALCDQMARGNDLTKETVWNEQVRNFKVAKIQVVKDEIRRENPDVKQLNNTVVDNKKAKSKKKSKKSTYEKTFGLFQKGWNAQEIADQRSLTVSTVNRHFSKLIKDEKVAIEEVLDEQKLQYLKDELGSEIEGPLGEIKEKLKSDVSWDDLHLYHASLLI